MTADSPLRILIVDDDPGMALLVRDRLAERTDWVVTVASSAAECRACAASQAFDVILLDRALPDCDGATLIGELRAGRVDIAIVMLTGADSAASATETLKLGAWDYVVKQPDLEYLDELPAIIRRCADRLAWQREKVRLRNEVELLSTAICVTADAVIIIDDRTRRVRFWNAAAERLFGWDAADVLGMAAPMIPRPREPEFAQLLERATHGQPAVGVETALQRCDGMLVDVSLTLTAVSNGDGSVRAFVGVARDISERKALERARRDFDAMLTHDIKNPLAAIRGFTSMLADADPATDRADCVAGIDRAAATIERLTGDFLMSAMIETGTLHVAREPVAVNSLVQTCARQFRATAAQKNIKLEHREDPRGVFVYGDHLQLERALANLVANAVKFTPPGGTVSVEAVTEEDRVLLSVRDSGAGISADELPRIFDKYHRGEGSDGTGLGLFIVRSLIEAHAGTVSVSSEPGRGSLFVISLPLDLTAAALGPYSPPRERLTRVAG